MAEQELEINGNIYSLIYFKEKIRCPVNYCSFLLGIHLKKWLKKMLFAYLINQTKHNQKEFRGKLSPNCH